MAQTAEQTDTNGHQVDLKSTSTSDASTGAGAPEDQTQTKPVPFRLAAHAQFVAAAHRSGMRLPDAADVAAELFDRATRAEDVEKALAEKKARLMSKVAGS